MQGWGFPPQAHLSMRLIHMAADIDVSEHLTFCLFILQVNIAEIKAELLSLTYMYGNYVR